MFNSTAASTPGTRAKLPDDLDQRFTHLKQRLAAQRVVASPLIIPGLVGGGFSLLLLILCVYLAFIVASALWIGIAFLLAGGAFGAFFVVARRFQNGILNEIFQVRRWIFRVIEGDLQTRVSVSVKGDCSPLLEDINALGDMLGYMCNNMDHQTRLQMEQLAQKTKSLEILYDAAAGLDVVHDLDELLTRFLHTLTDLVHAHAGVVRLMADAGQMRLVASLGFDENYTTRARVIKMEKCLCGEPVADDVLLQTDLSALEELNSQAFFRNRDQSLIMVTIPIRYSGKNLGAYNLFVEDTDLVRRDDIIHLFGSVGRHLGIAIEKARLERHARRLSIIEERTLLANELHDSLAQTLASLRFQVSLVEETVEQSRDRTGIRQIRTIKDGLDQANSQLRELLTHFRTRMDERGLIPAIESMVERFKKETGIAAFFQNDARDVELPPTLEVQVLHIVQEALTNVRKHSRAQNVRLLLRSDDADNYTVLVEDDGQGIEEKVVSDGPGEHIGLSIMRERAARLGGQINIESEAGEGTRVELVFQGSAQKHARDKEDLVRGESAHDE